MRSWHDAVYDVLVEECGAYDGESDRQQFRHHFPDCVEYRFMGALGFGGKVWCKHGVLTVTCYPEDRTIERDVKVGRANRRLAAIGTWELYG